MLNDILSDPRLLAILSSNLLGARRGQEGIALSRGLASAYGAREQFMQEEQRKQEHEAKLRLIAEKMRADAEKRKAEQAFQSQIAGAFGGPEQGMSATPFAATGQMPKANRVEQLRRAAMVAAQAGQDEMAKRYNDMANSLEEEFSTSPNVGMRDGQAYNYVLGKRGTERQVSYAPPPDNQVVPLGDRATVIDKRATAPGTVMPYGQSPDNKANLGLGYANLGVRKQELDAKHREIDVMREVGGGQAAVKTGELVAGLRKEYNALDPVKAFRTAQAIAKSAEQSPDTPAGDLDLIYAVGKVLDPNSVVREGEMNLVIKSGSPMQRFSGTVRMIAQGKGRLPPAQRAELVAMMKGRVRELKRAHDMSAEPYRRQAKMNKLPEDQIFGPPSIDELVDQYTR